MTSVSSVQYWFPTGIYHSALMRRGGLAFTGLLRTACQQVREEDEAGRAWCRENYSAGYTSYQTRRQLQRTHPLFAQLDAKVWPHVQRFTDRLDLDLREAHLVMSDCWVNIMSSGASHPWHAHPGAVVSGTFYVDTPKGCSSLEFEDPRLGAFDASPPQRTECRLQNRRHIAYEARPGHLILFESFLRHQVASATFEQERISISFNYAWV